MGNKKRTNKRQESDVWKGLAAGLIGGLVASWTMNRFQALVAKAAAPSNGNQGEDEDATQKLAQALATRTLHRSLTKAELQTAGPIVHYTYGTLLSREQYLHDIDRWKYRDGREEPYGPMTREQIEIWTAAIAADKKH